MEDPDKPVVAYLNVSCEARSPSPFDTLAASVIESVAVLALSSCSAANFLLEDDSPPFSRRCLAAGASGEGVSNGIGMDFPS